MEFESRKNERGRETEKRVEKKSLTFRPPIRASVKGMHDFSHFSLSSHSAALKQCAHKTSQRQLPLFEPEKKKKKKQQHVSQSDKIDR